MSFDAFMYITGARENNLKNVSLRIAKKKITVFTGVSGSGKSSLVFDTIAAESQRQLNETFSSYIRHQLPHLGKPDVDDMRNVSVAIVINQKRIGGNARSTVGTITDIYALLRLLFSRVGQPFVGYSHVFSFNNPKGMCPLCEGLGSVNTVEVDALIDKSKSLNQGAIMFPTFEVGGWRWTRYVHSGLFDNDKPLQEYSDEELHNLLYAKYAKLPNPSPQWHKTAQYEGVIPRFTRSFLRKSAQKSTKRYTEELAKIMTTGVCPRCDGARLNPTILSCTIGKHSIADYCAMQITDLLACLNTITAPVATPIVASLTAYLHNLIAIGLGYISLNRQTATLSGGESQRIKMVKHLGSSLTDMAYIFDEPSVGLHPADVSKLTVLLKELRDKGNTVLVVEHDPDIIAMADCIVDMGPKAGTCGGEVVYEGNVQGLLTSGTLTGQYLAKTPLLNVHPRPSNGFLHITHATVHNLVDVSVAIPKGILTVITGVAGSGKSSLIHFGLRKQIAGVVHIDQTELRGSKRSTMATYIGIMDDIRQLFATANNVPVTLFSNNSAGACPECKGLGKITTDLAFMDAVTTPCDMCHGTGFTANTLTYLYNGKNIAQVLSMAVVEAIPLFSQKKIITALRNLQEVGLGYIALGQPLSTLSGGERQRVKIAAQLDNNGQIYVLDEPSTGLHGADVDKLLGVLNRLVNKGSTVIVIEHNQDIISKADWIIDMGPGGGKNGGKVVFEGTPASIVQCETSLTGVFLRRYCKIQGE